MRRADDLLRKMTIEEKAMQVSCASLLALFDTGGLMRAQADALLKHGIGHIAGIGMQWRKPPEMVAKAVSAIQCYLLTKRV